jgi:hypothetical protein
MLVRQALLNLTSLNLAPSPFYSGYFGDRVLLFTQAGLNYDPPILSFLGMSHHSQFPLT